MFICFKYLKYIYSFICSYNISQSSHPSPPPPPSSPLPPRLSLYSHDLSAKSKADYGPSHPSLVNHGGDVFVLEGKGYCS